MQYSRLISMAVFTVLSAGTAAADKWDIPVTFDGTISSPKGKSYARDYLKIYGGCYAGDPEFPAKLDRAERELAKVDHAGDRALFAAYWTKVRAYIKPHMAGIAGIGTYAELRARVDGLSARLESDLPPVGADTSAAVAEMAARAKAVRETLELKDKIIEASPCLSITGNWSRFQYAVNKSSDATSEVFYKSGLEKLAEQYLKWLDRVAALDVEPPTTWEKHNAYTYAFVRFTGETQRLLPQAKTIASFAELKPDYGKLADAPAMLAKWDTAAATKSLELLAATKPGEANPKPSAAHIALAKKMLVDFRPSYEMTLTAPPGVTATDVGSELLGAVDPWPHAVKDFKEWRGAVLVHVRYQGFSTWYVTRAPALTAIYGMPTLPGIGPKDICWIAMSNFYNYSAGNPSGIPLNKWYREANEPLAPMLCKNARTRSPLKSE